MGSKNFLVTGFLAVVLIFVVCVTTQNVRPRVLYAESVPSSSYSVVTKTSSTSTSGDNPSNPNPNSLSNESKNVVFSKLKSKTRDKSPFPDKKMTGTKIYSKNGVELIGDKNKEKFESSNTNANTNGIATNETSTFSKSKSKIAILYNSLGIDSNFQLELLSAVYTALTELSENDLEPLYIDLATISTPSPTSNLMTSVQWLINNKTNTLISLVEPRVLTEFTQIYEGMKTSRVLKIVSPRLVQKNVLAKTSVEILCLQMSEMAQAVALLNRVEKVKVKTLIPVLDQDDSAQLEQLGYFIEAGEHRMEPIDFTSPIFVSPGEKSRQLRDILNDQTHQTSNMNMGILLLATRASPSVMEVANESRNFLQMRWFSPNFMLYEEWAHSTSQNQKNNATFGIYSVLFVGSTGWDNPTRRKTLRELSSQTGTSPRILSSILAYDAAEIARDHVQNKLNFPMAGLSGEIAFDSDGYRQDGIYFGMSAVPELVSPIVALLQPSTWILEEVLTVMETIEGQYLITDYTVATSSMLTRAELLNFADQTANSSNCREHLMEITTHDPFNQIPSNYVFNKENLPHHLLIPNQHGYGITFKCQHHHNHVHQNNTNRQEEDGDVLETTLRIACTPGGRFNDPVKCFRSHLKLKERRRRWATVPQSQQSQQKQEQTRMRRSGSSSSSYPAYSNSNQRVPQTNYVYPQDNQFYARSSQYAFPRDDSNSNSLYYQQPPAQYYSPGVDSSTPGTMTSRFDIPIESNDPSTPAPTMAAPPPAAKLPELRQVLKAAKPFVGSCVGAATGCSLCVLVLGRLPLGTLPPACTGPCFVGVFGSCGALLGRAFSETTVICTELFKQGYLDVDTFLADAEFGRRLKEESPMTLKGYQILATPLVDKMKKSKAWTELVSKFALPWAKYMKYNMGYSEEFNWTGYFLSLIGSPICYTCGFLHSLWDSQPTMKTIGIPFSFNNQSYDNNSSSITALLTITFLSLLSHQLISSFKSKRKSIFLKP